MKVEYGHSDGPHPVLAELAQEQICQEEAAQQKEGVNRKEATEGEVEAESVYGFLYTGTSTVQRTNGDRVQVDVTCAAVSHKPIARPLVTLVTVGVMY